MRFDRLWWISEMELRRFLRGWLLSPRGPGLVLLREVSRSSQKGGEQGSRKLVLSSEDGKRAEIIRTE